MPFPDKSWQDFQRDCDIFPAYSDYLYGVDERPIALHEIGLHPQLGPPVYSQHPTPVVKYSVVLSNGQVDHHIVLSPIEQPVCIKQERLELFPITEKHPETEWTTGGRIGDETLIMDDTAVGADVGLVPVMYKQALNPNKQFRRGNAGPGQHIGAPERSGRQRATSKGSPIQSIRRHKYPSRHLSGHDELVALESRALGTHLSDPAAPELPAQVHAQHHAVSTNPRKWSGWIRQPQLLPSTTTPWQPLCAGNPKLGGSYVIVHVDDLIADPCYSILPNQFRQANSDQLKISWSALLRPGVPPQYQYEAVFRIHVFSRNLARHMASKVAELESQGFAHKTEELKQYAGRFLPRLSILHPQPHRDSYTPIKGCSQQTLNYIHQQIPTLHCALSVVQSKAPHPSLNAPEDDEIILGYRQLASNWIRRLVMVIGENGRVYAFNRVGMAALAEEQRRALFKCEAALFEPVLKVKAEPNS